MQPSPRYAGVVFDLDGTLTQPDAIDFDAIRRRIGMTDEGSILHWIEGNAAGPDEAESMRAVVHDEEERALERMELGTGFAGLVDALMALRGRTLTGIATRNSASALGRFDALLADHGFPPSAELFGVQLARDAHSDALGRALRNKPSPEPVHEIQRRWGLAQGWPLHAITLHECHEHDPPAHARLLFVGDSHDDVLAGRRAGFRVGWMTHGRGRAHALAHVGFDALTCVAEELARPAESVQAFGGDRAGLA